MSDNKLVKIVVDAATLVGIAAGIGWGAKKLLKTPMTSDPSGSVENYAKWVAILAGAIATKEYLEDKKIIPAQ